jgi:hypothetical protein
MAVEAQATDALKKGAKKLIKRVGWGYILEWTPAIGFLVPGDIMLVWRELKGNIASPEGVLLLPIAIVAYGIKIILGIIEIWFDLGIIATLVTWAIAAFFALWIFFRNSGSSNESTQEGKPGLPPRKEDSQKADLKPKGGSGSSMRVTSKK